MTTLRPHGFIHDEFALDCTDTEEMRAVQYREILPDVPLFSHQRQGQGFVKTSPCALSQMSSTCVLLEDSSRSLG